jgi:rod shape-determining protein MreD
MSRIAGSSAEVAMRDFRMRAIPALSTIAAMFIVVLPIVATTPVIPDFALLVLITWRLLRPEIWPAQSALWLGLLNDLIAGHPLGQSVALWTMLFLALDVIDARVGFRDFWMDWLLAAAAILAHTVGVWYISLLMGSDVRFSVMIPQIAFAILAYPLVARFVLALDRRRLAR